MAILMWLTLPKTCFIFVFVFGLILCRLGVSDNLLMRGVLKRLFGYDECGHPEVTLCHSVTCVTGRLLTVFTSHNMLRKERADLTHVLRVYVCGRSRGGREGARMWEWDIYISFFYIWLYFTVILNVHFWVLSPCVKGKLSFSCFVYWWIIKIYLIWFDS